MRQDRDIGAILPSAEQSTGDERLVMKLVHLLVQPPALLPICGALEKEARHPQRNAHYICGFGPFRKFLKGGLGDGVDEYHRDQTEKHPDGLYLPEDDETTRLVPHPAES